MTDREKAIIMAYTGICMLTGNKFQIFHKYVEDIMGRPVFIHELGNRTIEKEIKEKTKDDFMALCADENSQEKIGRWIKRENEFWLFECSVCKNGYIDQPTCMGKPMFKYCPNCGAKMEVEE